jgi:hypothetical protein
MSEKAFAILDRSTGIIAVNSVGYSPALVRKGAVEGEREYLLSGEDHLTDRQIWKRLYRQGWRVIPVRISAE